MTGTQLHAAAAAGQTELVAACLQQSPAGALEKDADGNTPLHCAARGGHTEAVRVLLRAAPHAAMATDLCGSTPLHLAAQHGHAAILALLLQAQPQAARVADVLWSRLPIHCAAFGGQAAAEAVQLLLEAAPETATSVDCYNWMPLHLVVLQQDLAAVRLLLQAAPAAAMAGGLRGATPTHHAAFGGNVPILQQLVAAAPSTLAATDDYGHTPLHYASKQCHAGAVQVLLEAAPQGAMAMTNDGQTPLGVAAGQPNRAEGMLPIFQLLLSAAPGCATAADLRGWTPLHTAAAKGCPEAVQCLLTQVPETALIQDTSGKLPLNLALERYQFNAEAARCLLAVGGADLLLPALVGAGEQALPLFADLAARLPLSAEQWQQVPAGCPHLGRALAAVLTRSEQEAGWLVQRLPAVTRQRLQMFALCLNRRQRELGLHLPAAVVHRILALSNACS